MSNKKHQVMSLEALRLVASRFKVLSDATRLQILQLLRDGEASVSMLTESVESTQPNVSKHLKTLQDAGILSRRQEGNTAYYAISDPTVFSLCDVVCTRLQERFAAHAHAFAVPASRGARRRR